MSEWKASSQKSLHCLTVMPPRLFVTSSVSERVLQRVIFSLLNECSVMTGVSAFTYLYNKLVQPHLEHSMQPCTPNLVTDADCLEPIQRLPTRIVKGCCRLPYEEQLRRLDLHSLNRRHLRGDIVAAYKVYYEGLDLDPCLFFMPPVQSGLSGHSFEVLRGQNRRLRRTSLFSARLVKC